MEENTKNLFELIIDAIQLLIIISSAVWAYFRFRREDPLSPRVEFDLDCKFWGPQHNYYLTSFTVIASNKGNVEHRFNEIRIRVLGIKDDQPLTEFAKYPPMTNFPVTIMKEVNIIPPEYGYFFVRPGVKQSMNYVANIPGNIRFIIVRATFQYQSTGDIHTTEKVFEVKY